MNVPPPSAMHWRRPRITLSACWEAAGRWWLAGLCGLLLLTVLLLSLQRTQAHLLREARLEIALEGLRERLETNLSLGIDLADTDHAQMLLEDLLADDPALLAAEVFDASAISLFNTDRGAIGERMPPSWLNASMIHRSSDDTSEDSELHAWSVASDDTFTLGLPIRGPFNEITGQVSMTSTLPPSPAPWFLVGAALLVCTVYTLITLGMTIWLLRHLRAYRDDEGMDLAAIRLHAAEMRMADSLDILKRREDLS